MNLLGKIHESGRRAACAQALSSYFGIHRVRVRLAVFRQECSVLQCMLGGRRGFRLRVRGRRLGRHFRVGFPWRRLITGRNFGFLRDDFPVCPFGVGGGFTIFDDGNGMGYRAFVRVLGIDGGISNDSLTILCPVQSVAGGVSLIVGESVKLAAVGKDVAMAVRITSGAFLVIPTRAFDYARRFCLAFRFSLPGNIFCDPLAFLYCLLETFVVSLALRKIARNASLARGFRRARETTKVSSRQ